MRIRHALRFGAAALLVLIFSAQCRQGNEEEDLHVQYRQLKRSLEGFREIREEGGWPLVKAKSVLKEGVKNKHVEALRKRLEVTGHLKHRHNAQDLALFDGEVRKAVIKFQKDHGLPSTGIVDKRTLFELNIPVEYRLLQIEKNMERWKSFRFKAGKDYIFVNIADFSLEAVENDTARLSMEVIVGKLYRKTPTFSEKMRQIEFNPRWHLPPTILKEDVLPKIKADTSYLRKNNIKVYQDSEQLDPATIEWEDLPDNGGGLSLVRDAGGQNPLGIVKFLFPNKYAVYMHDTPAKDLFSKRTLAASSGCIRLSKARELAYYIMARDRGWPPEKVDSIITTGNTKRINLQQPLMVHIQYFTCWVDKGGDIQFRRDIYGRDVRIAKVETEAAAEEKKNAEQRSADW